jgi:hypothetical protein
LPSASADALASPWVRIILDAAGFDQLQFQSVDEPIEFGADTATRGASCDP